MKLNEMTEQQLQEFYSEVLAEYQNCLAQGLNLNMSRGKPGLEQLALSDEHVYRSCGHQARRS